MAHPDLPHTRIIENMREIDEQVAVATPENGVVVAFDEVTDSRSEGMSSTVGVEITSTRHHRIVLSFSIMPFEGERPPTQYKNSDATSTAIPPSLLNLPTAATLPTTTTVHRCGFYTHRFLYIVPDFFGSGVVYNHFVHENKHFVHKKILIT